VFASELAAKEAAAQAAEKAFEDGVGALREEHARLGELRDGAKARVLEEGGLKCIRAVLQARKKADKQVKEA